MSIATLLSFIEYIAEEDVAGLRTAYAKAKLNGDSVWLFRFAAIDYYSVKLDAINDASGATGYLSEETVSHKYEVERMELKTKISDLRNKLMRSGEKQKEREHFIKAIRKFMQMERLTAPLLRELIDRIEVFETEGVGKNRTQRIVIYYRFVGYIEMPDAPPRDNYKADTRKGVAVEYISKPLSA